MALMTLREETSETEGRTPLLVWIQLVDNNWRNWIADNAGIFMLSSNYCTIRARSGEHAFTHIGNLQELTYWNKYLGVYIAVIICICMSSTSTILFICLRVLNWHVRIYIAQFVETGDRMFTA
jgi:hypothetical protein